MKTSSKGWQVKFDADRDEWVEMLGMNPPDKLLELVGITRQTWLRILTGRRPSIPAPAYRIARLHRYGDLSQVLGRNYVDFWLRGDGVLLPGMKYPISPIDLRGVWFDLQVLPMLKRELSELRTTTDWVQVSPTLSNWLKTLGKAAAQA